jgi:WD40 repeat protein
LSAAPLPAAYSAGLPEHGDADEDHPHAPREGDHPAVAHARRMGRELTEQWVAHHAERSNSHAQEEEAHLESMRQEAAALAREAEAAHEERLADLQSEEARAQAAHYSRVAEDAGIVHPREAREWPTEHVHVRALAVLPPQQGVAGGGQRVASASDDGLVRIFSLVAVEGGWVDGACMQVLQGHSGAVQCLAALSPLSLASGGKDGCVGLWDLRGHGKCQRLMPGHRGAVLALVVFPDGRLASAGEDGSVRLWDPALKASDPLQTLWGHEAHEDLEAPEGGREDVCALAVVSLEGVAGSRRSSGSRHVAYLASGGMDGQVLVWDVASRQGQGVCRLRLKGHTSCITALAQLPDERIVSASRDGSIKLWDATSSTCVGSLQGHTAIVMCLAMHPDSERLLSGSGDGSVHVWDMAHPSPWSVSLEPQVHGHKDGIWTMAILEDATVLSGGFGATIRAWDVEECHIKWRPELSPSPKGAKRSHSAETAAAAAELVQKQDSSPTEAPAPSASRTPSPTAKKSTRALLGSSRSLVATNNPLSASTNEASIRFITRQ